jgi:hypothetical protein
MNERVIDIHHGGHRGHRGSRDESIKILYVSPVSSVVKSSFSLRTTQIEPLPATKRLARVRARLKAAWLQAGAQHEMEEAYSTDQGERLWMRPQRLATISFQPLARRAAES